MTTVIFTSSDSFLEIEPQACEHAAVEVSAYLEGTYDALRTLDGVEIAHYVNGGWQLSDGRRFSDWAVSVA